VFQYSNLEQGAIELQAALAQEGERGSVSASTLMERSSQLADLQNQLSAKQEQLAEASSLLTRANLDKQQLEARLETSLQEMVKLSSEKNEALSDAACANRDKQSLQNKTEGKLQVRYFICYSFSGC
jgi:chromosome segregation ATPase